MKLATLSRRSYRRPSRQQSPTDFFAKETESGSFFETSSEPRLKSEDFFSSKEPEEEPKMPEEEETPVAKEPDEEPLEAKLPEEEEPMAKSPEEEEPLAAKEAAMEKDPGPIAAKCSCGCGGACVKAPESSGEEKLGSGQIQAKSPGSTASGTSDARANPAPVHQHDCTPARQSVIASAVGAAKNLAQCAVQAGADLHLPGDPPEARGARLDHYERWFGEFNPSRAHFVRNTFASIGDALGGTIRFRCDCSRNLFAYVHPDGTRMMYFGKLFWNQARWSGFDSKPGVLIHELAHDVRPSIGDQGYGPGKAEALAKKSPDQAVQNADNYEYYAETSR
jgi:hypothetical protein